jgi:O-antigen/teichoic acid export membrane protein
VYAACQWGMLVALAKLGSPELVGAFALGLAVTAPIVQFANLKLRSIQATDARHEYGFRDYLSVRLATSAVAFAVVIAAAFAGSYTPEQRIVIVAVGLAKVVESVSDIYYGLIQQHEMMHWIASSMMVKGVLSLVAFTGVVYSTGSVAGAGVALAATWAAVLLGWDIPRGRQLSGERRVPSSPRRAFTDKVVFFRLVRTAVPLGIVVTLGSLFVNIPRYFIEHHCGSRALGLYAAIAYLMVAGSMVVNALGQSAGPRLAKLYASGDRASFAVILRKLTLSGAALGIVGLVSVGLAGRPLLALIYRAEYAEYAGVLCWTMAAMAVNYLYIFVGTAINAMRNYRVQLPIHLASTVLMVASCAVLVPRYGIVGGAWAMLCCTVFEAVLYSVCAAKLFSGWKTDDRTNATDRGNATC